VIVTGHQINFLPGMSVIEKVRAADACIWMDAFQYERHGFVNRNRFTDGSWLTVPVCEHDTFAPINQVRIADPTGRAREKIARTLEHRLGTAAAPFATELRKPYKLLVGLNWQLLRTLLDALSIDTVSHFQSHLDSGHAVPVVSDDDAQLLPARERLAQMVAEIGGTVWLSGPSGRNYLDEQPFRDRGIDVKYFEYAGPNPTALEALKP
jgi:hypothetical protein